MSTRLWIIYNTSTSRYYVVEGDTFRWSEDFTKATQFESHEDIRRILESFKGNSNILACPVIRTFYKEGFDWEAYRANTAERIFNTLKAARQGAHNEAILNKAIELTDRLIAKLKGNEQKQQESGQEQQF